MNLQKAADKLRRATEKELKTRGTMSSGRSTMENADVDYFALTALLDFYDSTIEAAQKVAIAKDALSGVYFTQYHELKETRR